MKKKFLILPVVAALFAACTNDELLVNENQVQQTVDDGAIVFDAYLNRAVTRAGAVGTLTTSGGTTNLQGAGVGFGVFAYYANGDLYSENAIPDFMYNQQVTYSTGWTYSPVKYWPNEFGSTAISTGVDRVTFFAYAPYVGVDPATGQLTSYYDGTPGEKSTETGITALTRNGKTGDPYVRYVTAFEPANCVDLCYGVAADAYTSSVGAADGANNIKAGDPFINVAKPEIESKLKFNFKHALAKLIIKVDADVDLVTHGDADALDDNTRIWVRSITFDGVAQRGYLNLNSGMWYDVIDNTKISHASVTVHDGRRDGAEALADDSYETPIGFNAALVQSDVYSTTDGTNTTGAPTYATVSTTTTGVEGDLKNLFSGSNELLVIPANEQLKVTIVYDVETADPTLPSYLSDSKTKGSTVENKITKSITLGGSALKLEAGNAYTINLHLGMTSVKFDAKVAPWDNAGSADDTWVPINSGTSISTAAGSPASVSVSADAATGLTAVVTGLTAGSTVAIDDPHTGDNPGIIASATLSETTVPASRTVTVTYSLNENNTVTNKNAIITVTESGSGSTVTKITVNQAAAPLNFTAAAYEGASHTVTCTISNTDVTELNASGITVTMTKDDAEFTDFTLAASKVITLTSYTSGTYKVTIKAHDAAPVTVSFVIP